MITIIKAGTGFDTHPHQVMEIISTSLPWTMPG